MKKLFILASIFLVWGLASAAQSQSGSKEQIAKETMKYVSKGSSAYLRQDYKKAIKLYSKALKLEREEPTFDRDVWRVVVDNLGMSYGLTGNHKKAREIFKYGLSKDKGYPMFYYNLACTYAEMNDLDNAIINLKRAFKYKDNMIPGERMPSPEADNSFARHLNNPKFQHALKELDSI